MNKINSALLLSLIIVSIIAMGFYTSAEDYRQTNRRSNEQNEKLYKKIDSLKEVIAKNQYKSI